MRLKETTVDSSDSGRLLETRETLGNYRGLVRLRDYWGIMRLRYTNGDS